MIRLTRRHPRGSGDPDSDDASGLTVGQEGMEPSALQSPPHLYSLRPPEGRGGSSPHSSVFSPR